MQDLQTAPKLFALTLLLAGIDASFANQKSISLTPIGTYASGIYAMGGAEDLWLMTLGRRGYSS